MSLFHLKLKVLQHFTKQHCTELRKEVTNILLSYTVQNFLGPAPHFCIHWEKSKYIQTDNAQNTVHLSIVFYKR